MNIMELGAIGELVGGVAVIASLLYVGLQVRQSNAINRAESVRSFVRDFNTYLYRVLENESVFREGSADFSALSHGDQSKVHLLLTSQFMLGLDDSVASPDRADEFSSFIDGSIAIGAKEFPQWWNRFKGMPESLAPDYVARIEALAPDAPTIRDTMPWFGPDNPERA